ncbi:hypothetical protein RintRC_0450 [Richelia intracellularis]|nr:hypothetical protein RintRC_0450 [Richelia intracellularis]
MPGERTSSLVALSLGQIAQYHSQQDPTFKTSLAYTQLTATSALEKLKEQEFSQEQLPSPSTMAQVLNRMGYGLRKVVKAKPQKKLHKLMISSTTSKNFSRNQQTSLKVKRLSMDSKATVNIGGYSRGRTTRGDNQAEEHHIGCTEKYTPCGILDEEDSGQLFYIKFGNSSYKTRDFIVDTLIQ